MTAVFAACPSADGAVAGPPAAARPRPATWLASLAALGRGRSGVRASDLASLPVRLRLDAWGDAPLPGTDDGRARRARVQARIDAWHARP